MKRSYLLIIILVAGLLCEISYKIGYQDIAATRVYPDLKSNVESIKSANISVISKTYHDDMAGYSVGASGVVFSKDAGGYYAITADHVVHKKNTKLLIMTVNDQTLIEYQESHPNTKITSADGYYDTLSVASVVYENEDSDFAIVYFKSNQKLVCAPIAHEVPQKGDKVVAIGTYSDQNKYFIETYGQVKQNNTSLFRTEDGAKDTIVLKHSAFSTEGFSGGGVFNQKMEIVGMNIGGQQNIFGRFSYGAMLPCKQINECIAESNIIK